MSEVDVEEGVRIGYGEIDGGWMARGVPEIGPRLYMQLDIFV